MGDKAWPLCCMQAKQREQEECVRRAERIRKLEARQKQEEEAAVKALSQQLLAHQVCVHTLCKSGRDQHTTCL